MIKEIVVDEEFLGRVCFPCDGNEDKVIEDLLDTAEKYKDRCAGLAANQVGHLWRVILIKYNDAFDVLVNPKIVVSGGGTNWLPETCLSRPNKEPIYKTRYKKVKVEYEHKGHLLKKTYRGFFARVVQHELDHLEGILI